MHSYMCVEDGEVIEDIVLILVLMEDALVRYIKRTYPEIYCLNPCFNGRCTRTLRKTLYILPTHCLNPCFNGRCTRTH